MSKRDDEPRGPLGINIEWVKQYVVVLEFLGMLAVAGIVGWWLDERYGWQPWGLLTGLLVGTAAGIYTMIRASEKLNK